MAKTHDGPSLPMNPGKAKQFGKYSEQGGASRSNNITSMASPGFTPVKKSGAAIPNPMDIMAAPPRRKK